MPQVIRMDNAILGMNSYVQFKDRVMEIHNEGKLEKLVKNEDNPVYDEKTWERRKDYAPKLGCYVAHWKVEPKAEISTVGKSRKFPAVRFDLVSSLQDQYEMLLIWIKEREEWVAVEHRWFIDGKMKHKEEERGPFALDDYCKNMLFKVYNSLDFDKVSKTPPSELQKFLAKEEINSLRIHPSMKLDKRSGSHWLDYVDIDQIKSFESQIEKGEFLLKPDGSRIGHYDEHDGSFEYYFKWSDIRKEWVAATTGPELDHYDGSIPYYTEGKEGPYSLDKAAKRKLLMIYGLTEKDVSLRNAARTSPKKLCDKRNGIPQLDKIGRTLELMKKDKEQEYGYDYLTDDFCIMGLSRDRISCNRMEALLRKAFKEGKSTWEVTKSYWAREEQSFPYEGTLSRVKNYDYQVRVELSIKKGKPVIETVSLDDGKHEWDQWG